MPGLTIEREILIEAPVKVMWRTITEPDQISQWFADKVELVVYRSTDDTPADEALARWATEIVPVVREAITR